MDAAYASKRSRRSSPRARSRTAPADGEKARGEQPRDPCHSNAFSEAVLESRDRRLRQPASARQAALAQAPRPAQLAQYDTQDLQRLARFSIEVADRVRHCAVIERQRYRPTITSS
jgi:hypothetical protein